MPIGHVEGNYTAPPDGSTGSNARAASCSATATPRGASPTRPTRTARRAHRRHRERGGQRRRPDAAPRALLRERSSATMQGIKMFQSAVARARGRDDLDRPVTEELVREHNLSDEEYERILEILGREPNLVELGIFSAMWSEHCSYKSSRVHLQKFPTKGPRVIQGPGENAGVVDIGDGLAVASSRWSRTTTRRSSSRTRARPPASAASCATSSRWARGPSPGSTRCASARLDASAHAASRRRRRRRHRRLRQLHRRPDRRRRDQFDAGYDGNILVNAFTCGVARDRPHLLRARRAASATRSSTSARRPGATASTARPWPPTSSPPTSAKQKRPTVQVGDPFMEKLLLEACLELFDEDRRLVGIQDMGAAGLTSSSFEMAGRAGSGLELDLSTGPASRETGMTPYEIMLSRVAGADAPRRATRPAASDVLDDLPQVGPRRRRDRPRHRHRPRAFSSSRAASSRTCRRRRSRTARPSTTGRARPLASPDRPVSLADRAGAHGRSAPVCAQLLASPERRREVLDLEPVRPHGPDQHGRAAGRRRRRHPGQGHEEGHRHEERRQPLLLHGGPLPRRRDRGRRSRAVGGLHGSAAPRDHRLPQLRQSREARDHGAVRGGGARHRRRLPRARSSGRLGQRLALQRDRRPRDPADAHGRNGRAARGRRQARAHAVSRERAT